MKTKSNPNNIGAAVIGLGRGRSHVSSYAVAENCDLIAVCDINEEKAKAVAEQYGCDYYTDYKEMLKRDDIDLVSVVTPSGMHSEMAVEVAKAGKHCLAEKPLDVTLEAIDAAIAAFDKYDKKLGCIFQNRLEPAVALTKQAVAEGRLGDLVVGNVMIKWYRNDDYYLANGGWRGTWKWDGGGSLMNQSVHTIDILQWIMGEPESVTAQIKVANHKIESEDIGCALVKFKNGAFGTITGSTATYPGFGTSIEIHGTKGGICVKDNQIVSWKIHNDDKEAMEAEEKRMIELTAKVKGSGANDPNAISQGTTFKQVQDMVDACRDEKRRPIIEGREGRNAVKLILGIYEAAKEDKKVVF